MIKLTKICFFFSCVAFAQFSPVVGEEGTIAIHMDSPLFTSWAEKGHLERGWIDIADTTQGKVTFGEIGFAYGAPDPKVLSLGDGGAATFFFEQTLFDGEGYDFAVYENGFDDHFLELAFVEVSSDGKNFIRFPSQSETSIDTQIGAFDLLETRKIHNLAGKYPAKWGTPFDLSELEDHDNLDVKAISHIRIVDVVGSIDSVFCSHDAQGRIVNDPWPTPFESGGFDLDAIGVIHQNSLSIEEHAEVLIYPNPVSIHSSLHLSTPYALVNVKLIDVHGYVQYVDYEVRNPLSKYISREGLYVLEYEVLGQLHRRKLIIRQ